MNLEKACCIDWAEFQPELQARIEEEIQKIIVEKELPRSIFSIRLNTIKNCYKFCPVCGGGLTETTAGVEPPRSTQRNASSPQAPPSPSKPDIPCPVCKSTGILGRDEKNIEMKCGSCHGKGLFPGNEYHIVEKVFNGKLQKVIQPIPVSASKLAAIENRTREIIEQQKNKKADPKKVSGEDLT